MVTTEEAQLASSAFQALCAAYRTYTELRRPTDADRQRALAEVARLEVQFRAALARQHGYISCHCAPPERPAYFLLKGDVYECESCKRTRPRPLTVAELNAASRAARERGDTWAFGAG